uniref:Uncharacterized protein n=1 Tax=viral metagenome TaxID=1070528 RepID=A0A6H1ZWH1_9ZZZZ
METETKTTPVRTPIPTPTIRPAPDEDERLSPDTLCPDQKDKIVRRVETDV